jgi:hypothetical protein
MGPWHTQIIVPVAHFFFSKKAPELGPMPITSGCCIVVMLDMSGRCTEVTTMQHPLVIGIGPSSGAFFEKKK